MKHFLFFDIETTGLIKLPKSKIDFRKKSAFPEIVQISWQLHSYTKDCFSHIDTKNYIIRTHNYTIPYDSIKIHGITNEFANENGVNKLDVLKEFLEIIKTYDNLYIVSHNIEFDVTILFFHIYNSFKKDFNQYVHIKIPCICTMLDSIDICKIPSISQYYKQKQTIDKYKYPKLSELYKTLFEVEPDGKLHDSSYDVEILVKCFKELINRSFNIKIRFASFVTELE
jgi:DNA polymerase-3 subunit alpha